MEIIPYMVQGHDDHDQSPEQVDGTDPVDLCRIHGLVLGWGVEVNDYGTKKTTSKCWWFVSTGS